MFNILSIVWSLPGGGVSHYVGSIHKLNRFNDMAIRHVVIRKKQWQIHQGLRNELAPKEIFIKSRLDPRWIVAVQKQIRSTQSNLLFVHGFNGHMVANTCKMMGLNIPILASYHGPYHSPIPNRKRWAKILNRYLIFFLKHVADHIITVTRNAKRELISQGVPADKITAIHNGIQMFRPTNKKDYRSYIREMGIPDEALVLGTTSGFHPVKGLEYLIKALATILKHRADIHLLLFGTGPLEDELKRLAKSIDLQNRVDFMGFQENLEQRLPGLDIFILPSLSECHSIGLLEAMRAKLAIVCTDIPGNVESIRNGFDGIVVPARNPKDLSDAIVYLIQNPELRNSLALSARKRFEKHFTESRMLENTYNAIMQFKIQT